MFMDSFSDTIFVAAFLDALTSILAFFLSAWGAAFVFWGGAKAARRVFYIEAEPWKGQQTPALEEVRRRFAQRITLGLDFFVASDLVRLLMDPSFAIVGRIGLLVFIRILMSFIVTREFHLPLPGLVGAVTSRRRKSV